ncbi:MAG: response regulator [Oscillospiraceae bacterium]|nr:response regulator [Oscillospiraceae bacterium]
MYHCKLRIGYIGKNDLIWERISAINAPEGFSYEFSHNAENCDVVFAEFGAGELPDAAEIILLADKDADCTGLLARVSDLWITPMTAAELDFRLEKWQRESKLRRDLWQSENYLDSLIDSTPDLIWFKALDGSHVKVNNSFCDTVHKSKEQIRGQKHTFIWDVESESPSCIASDNEAIHGRRTSVSEEIVDTGSGERMLTTYKSPLYDLDGSVMGTVGIGTDVTKERAYEREIIRKNRVLEKVFMSIDCGVMTHSLDGKQIMSANDAALKILGYSTVEEMMASGFDMVADSVLDEDKEKLRAAIVSLKSVGDTINVEYRARHKDGRVLHIMGSVGLLCEDGESFYRRFLLDVTDQKIREQETERRQMELVHALCIDYNLVCSYDLDTGKGNTLRNLDCEKHMLKTMFTEKTDLESSMDPYIGSCVYEDDREMFRGAISRESLKAALADKDVYHINYRTLCGGQIKYFQMKAVRTGDWENNHTAVLGFRSVDDEIRAEMEKKSLLENALMQASRANKAKSVFLSNMSHDIRTPMNAIVGFTTLALSHINNKSSVEDYLKKIMTSGNHLLGLINDVLDMSRIESGKMRLDESPCSLSEIICGLRNILNGDIVNKQIEFNVDAVDVLDEDIVCDKLRLNQVLLNLLNNAIKYTEQGGKVTFRITEHRGGSPDSADYEFLIKDTGIGMDKEFLEHIFEPFERERNTTLSGIQGTGLGMAITKNIVDMMNGTIDVQSEQGVGTECRVVLTFKLCSVPHTQHEMPEFKNCHALVIDDDFNTCDSVTLMLQQLGMRAEWTLSGKEALLRTKQAYERSDEYKVYIVDCFLPDMNGLEVIRRIRREEGENVTIILLTAYDWTDIEDEAREAGVTAFCSKPLFMSELKRCLESIVMPKSADEKEQTPRKIRSGRILLVEDNELNCEIATALLTEVDFLVEHADNGKTAVDMVKNSEPGYYNVVLMDVQMPVMNGYEATRQIRALDNKHLAQIPILAMTANAFEEDKQEALRSGMNGHLAKPINIGNLLETLDKIIGG